MTIKVILTIINLCVTFYMWYQFGRASVFRKLQGTLGRACEVLGVLEHKIEEKDKTIEQLKDEIKKLKGGKDETL